MAATVYDQMLLNYVHAHLREPGMVDTLTLLVRRMNDGEMGDWLNFVVQKPFDDELNIYDAYVMMWFWYYLLSGDLAHAEIGVKHKPFKDRQREENQTALTTGLHKAFSATVNPNYSGDGTLRWAAPVKLCRTIHEEDPEGAKTHSSIVTPAGDVPLEIGTTKAARTLGHLWRHSRGLARWPYESDSILLVYWVNKPSPQRVAA